MLAMGASRVDGCDCMLFSLSSAGCHQLHLFCMCVQEYTFQVQVPGKEDNKLLTVGRAELDMSHYVLADGTPQAKMIPMMFKVGMASTGYLKVTITAEVVASGGESDDGMTEVSGMTGMTANLGEEQDLSGESPVASEHWAHAHRFARTLDTRT